MGKKDDKKKVDEPDEEPRDPNLPPDLTPLSASLRSPEPETVVQALGQISELTFDEK